MMTLAIKKEISKNETKILLEYVFGIASYFTFVIRPDLSRSADIKKLLDQLSQFLIEVKIVSEWSGTVLIGQEANLYKYVLNSESQKILLDKSATIFNWIQPHLPEDLSFLYSNGLDCLTNIAHENDAWLSLSEQDYFHACKILDGLFLKNN